MELRISSRFCGPPQMGHGGYVAGQFAERRPGCVQVTLRKPTPLDTALELSEQPGGKLVLLDGDTLIAEAEPATLDLRVPAPPSLQAAAQAEQGSPSFRNARGVHPICFGCGNERAAGDALRIFAGPCEVEGAAMVAGRFHPGSAFADAQGEVSRAFMLAALDCPGAFAFIADEVPAGLLGRIVFDSYRSMPASAEYIVTGWQIGREGRKLFAGTAVFDASGALCAAAKATWFQIGPR